MLRVDLRDDNQLLTIDLPKDGIDIYIGGMLIGNGKLWIGDFQVQIDGKDINR